MPERIQRQRTRGWRMPEGAVYVGRPSRWGNPFVLGTNYMWLLATAMPFPVGTYREPGIVPDRDIRVERLTDPVTAIAWFRAWYSLLVDRPYWGIDHLRGHDLACWCPLDQPCHADVLLELANA